MKGGDLSPWYTVTVADLNATLGEPASASPCTWQDDGYTIVCEGLINSVNSWFASGFRVIPKEGVTDVNVSFILDDLGNVDKDLNPNITYASLSLNRTIEELLATKPVVADNTALIAAPIAGLLAGLVMYPSFSFSISLLSFHFLSSFLFHFFSFFYFY